MTTRFPLIFTFSQPVSGNGFAALVVATGRAIASNDEGEGWWIYGVTPGGIAEGGTRYRSEAQEAFRNAFAEILFEIATEANDFGDFKTEVEKFFRETNRPMNKQWVSALEAVRSGALGSDLPQKKAEDYPPAIKVELVGRASIESNHVPTETAIAA